MVTPECWMTSIDLTDAYLTVSIFRPHMKYLKFMWQGQLFRFTCLPFGASMVPRKFTKLLKPFLSIVRQQGFSISGYLDDFTQVEQFKLWCIQAVNFAFWLIVDLGFLPKLDKSVLEPVQCIQSLGFIIDSINMTITQGPGRVAEWLARSTHDLLIAGSRLIAATQ